MVFAYNEIIYIMVNVVVEHAWKFEFEWTNLHVDFNWEMSLLWCWKKERERKGFMCWWGGLVENPRCLELGMLLLNDGNPYYSISCMLNEKIWCGSLGLNVFKGMRWLYWWNVGIEYLIRHICIYFALLCLEMIWGREDVDI